MAIKRVVNAELGDVFGESWSFRESESSAARPITLKDVLKQLIYGMRTVKKTVTFQDEEQALLVAQSVRDAKNGILEFEETPHKWLLEYIKGDGARLVSPNATVVVKALETEVKDEAKPVA